MKNKMKKIGKTGTSSQKNRKIIGKSILLRSMDKAWEQAPGELYAIYVLRRNLK